MYVTKKKRKKFERHPSFQTDSCVSVTPKTLPVARTTDDDGVSTWLGRASVAPTNGDHCDWHCVDERGAVPVDRPDWKEEEEEEEEEELLLLVAAYPYHMK